LNLSIPTSPSVEQLRKQAKDLLRAARRGERSALARTAAHHPDGGIARLSDAQLVLAREHRFRSWPRLKAYVERIEAHGDDLRHPFHAGADYHEERASGLLNTAQDGLPHALGVIRRHHPTLGESTDAQIRAEFTLRDARYVQARQHGFPSWDRFLRHLQRLRREGGEPFMVAREAIDRHDQAALGAILDRNPALLRARGTNGNDLLQLATATCDPDTVRLLLERGADAAQANDRGATPLHQAAYGGSATIARLLLDAGAAVDGSAYGDGGTPVTWALFWGHREVADLIAAVDVVPRNLRVVAGLGRSDDI
jgi:Ankyrin repeats (3 copies)